MKDLEKELAGKMREEDIAYHRRRINDIEVEIRRLKRGKVFHENEIIRLNKEGEKS